MTAHVAVHVAAHGIPRGIVRRCRNISHEKIDMLFEERYMRQGGLVLAAGRVRSKEKKRTKKTGKIRPTQNTPRNPQPPGDRDQLETARGETRPRR